MKYTVNLVTDPKEKREVFKLRYKAYVEEWGFEKPEDHPEGLEQDVYDNYSRHFAAKDNTGKVIGTVRLIRNSTEGFPIEKHTQLNIKSSELPRESLAEISRLAISKELRQRAEDSYIYGPLVDRRNEYRAVPGSSHSGHIDKREKPAIIFRLYSAMYKECKKNGITHVYAIMAKGLYLLIKKSGIRCFQQIGDPVNYHGLRTPYLLELTKLESEDFANNDKLREEFMRYL